LSLFQRAVFAAFVPFRRLWDADWFVPVARIGERGVNHYPLTQFSTEITAQATGELFLFVNDAVAPVNIRPPGLGWKAYYANNDGTAEITVTRLPGAPPVSAAR
jgi:hypothetical protein